MKTFIKIFSVFLTLAFIMSCQEEHELGALLDKSEVTFEVTQDLVTDPGGNTVILKNTTPGTISIWDYGSGKSNRVQDTLHFPFKGDYVIKFSAVTGGGIVEMDPVTVTVSDNNFNYVSDPLWTLLSGGVGQEKTWLLDLDADGVSKFFNGPVYFSSNNYVKDSDCVKTGACWVWEADWKSNTWIGDKGDYGTMTFSLKDGANVNVDHKMIPSLGIQSGSYFLDASTLTLKMTNAQPLQNSWAGNDIGDWNNLVIISLTENTMQLAARHKTKAEYMIFNYISKEYSDNWGG